MSSISSDSNGIAAETKLDYGHDTSQFSRDTLSVAVPVNNYGAISPLPSNLSNGGNPLGKSALSDRGDGDEDENDTMYENGNIEKLIHQEDSFAAQRSYSAPAVDNYDEDHHLMNYNPNRVKFSENHSHEAALVYGEADLKARASVSLPVTSLDNRVGDSDVVMHGMVRRKRRMRRSQPNCSHHHHDLMSSTSCALPNEVGQVSDLMNDIILILLSSVMC